MRLWVGRRVEVVLGSMVCPLFVLGGDANTGSAGYVCLEVELMDGESDFYAAMLAVFAFAAFLDPRSSQWFALVLRRFSWMVRMISLPRCLLRSPLPR